MDDNDELEEEVDLNAKANLYADSVEASEQSGITEMLKNAKSLATFAGEHNCERAEQLANELITELQKEASRKSLRFLKSILAEHENKERDDFADDGTLGKIWGITLKASSEAEQYKNEVLASWRSPYHKAMAYFQEAIKGLAARWGFYDDIAGMLRFVLTSEGRKYINEDSYSTFSWWGPFLIGVDKSGREEDWACYNWLLVQDDKDFDYDCLLDSPSDMWLLKRRLKEDMLPFGKFHERLAELAWERANNGEEKSLFNDLWQKVFDYNRVSDDGEEHDNEDDGWLICDAVYLCFNPDALKVLSDAEIVFRVLFCFINGCTNNDTIVRYGLLRRKIAQLETEV